ncbi:MAG TPA: phosphoglucomutase (alpha-D-glucose-1,6-bisphosphate-dependent), partial [Casimicrobiaceae bacterium]|nr:phosphoglucomutase (alpha-D-glucose-1,6-bisphosphate-dependent) [Casimicrobiaceae bacterium]
MSAEINRLAGQPAGDAQLVDVAKLVAAYHDLQPDPAGAAQRVAFGTSGHRGTSFDRSFNEAHVLAITQAICLYRRENEIDGPLFIGIDTHALSQPAFESALEVLAANGVETLIAKDGEYTPTPAVSHAILGYNRNRTASLADGIVVTPSHNPPDNGGFKYNPPNGGPADSLTTGWIEKKANGLLEARLDGVQRMPINRARRAATTREHDFLSAYVDDLRNVIDFDVIRASGLRMGVDPLGGAGVRYWGRIAERYGVDLTVVSEDVDPTFRFMTLDWDGRIRMDPSSAYAMRRLIALKDRYDVAFACDTDHDRHGIVTPSKGLMPSNHYLTVAADYLLRNRNRWQANAAVAKTVVTTAMIDRVVARLGRKLYEAPVGFKWFVDGLLDGSLAFACEESAGASFCRIDGTVWTTDKDGIVPSLLAAEMTARSRRDPGALYDDLTRELGNPAGDRVDASATPEQKQKLAKLAAKDVRISELVGEAVDRIIDKAPGNDAPIGGIKAIAADAWFAARPSGTEAIYK